MHTIRKVSYADTFLLLFVLIIPHLIQKGVYRVLVKLLLNGEIVPL